VKKLINENCTCITHNFAYRNHLSVDLPGQSLFVYCLYHFGNDNFSYCESEGITMLHICRNCGHIGCASAIPFEWHGYHNCKEDCERCKLTESYVKAQEQYTKLCEEGKLEEADKIKKEKLMPMVNEQIRILKEPQTIDSYLDNGGTFEDLPKSRGFDEPK
jgi:hypothetical protein